MFLLVSVRHVGAHPDEHQHGVSIQISINLGKTFLRISRIRNIPLTWILARVFVYLPPFISQIPDFIYWTVLILFFDLSWMAWHWKPAIGNPLSIPTAVYLDDEAEEESDSARLISDDVEDITMKISKEPNLEHLKRRCSVSLPRLFFDLMGK